MDDDCSVKEAAALLGVSTRSMRTYLKERKFPGAKRIEGKFGPEYRIPREDVLALRGTIPPEELDLPRLSPPSGDGDVDSTHGSQAPGATDQSRATSMTIPLAVIVDAYQRSLREVGKLHHQVKRMKEEIARLKEEIENRETLLAVLQEQRHTPGDHSS